MALQKTIIIRGGISVTDAIHEVKAVNIKPSGRARIKVVSYESAEAQANGLNCRIRNYLVSGDDYTTYFNTPDESKTILQKAEDYLLTLPEFSGAAQI